MIHIQRKLHLNMAGFCVGKNIAIVLLMLSSMYVNGQVERVKWRDFGRNKTGNFYEVEKDFKQYWQGKKIEKGKGYKVFKRWETLTVPRVYPSGDLALISTTYPNFIAWQQSHKSSVTGNNDALKVAAPTDPVTAAPKAGGKTPTSNWTALGPFIKPSGYDGGVGRVDFLRFDPMNSNTMYVGTPDGGLWKSTNGGSLWTTNTDFLPVIGCSDLAIHPTNTQIMYLATGNWEYDRRSIGVLKSSNGGATWNTTGLVWTALDNYKIRRLVMHPTNPSIMMIATDGGMFRTTDAWATYTQTISGANDLYDIEFKPGDPNTVYAAGKDFFKSTNNGVSWSKITTGLPPSASVSRIMLGVSSANAAYVYAVMGNANGGFLGLYRSTNSGTSFSVRSSMPNILSSEKDGSGSGGQATHDLAIAVSPANADLITIGGISQWRSTNGGTNWKLLTYWYGEDPTYPGQGDGPEPYVHADVQSIEYLPGSSTTMFTTCDGGISKSINNGATWTDISNNLSISQQTDIALSATTSNIMVAGLQDIGTLKAQAGNWSVINGGDGESAFIDRSSDLYIVTSNPNGAHDLSTDGGPTKSRINGLPEGLEFFSPISQDPVNIDIVYAGGREALYRSTDFTETWTKMGTPAGTGGILRFVVAPSDNKIIYAIKYDAISKSVNSGSTWTNITADLPVAEAALTNVTISNTDPDEVWVTFSGYSDGNKVFETSNGGTSWKNVSDGLPNLPFNTIVYENDNKNDVVYLGGDIGVYYMDKSSKSWEPFFTGLPNTKVTDLEIFYPGSKLRAATYGRGTWETSLNNTQTEKLGSTICFTAATNKLHVVGTGGKAPYTYSIDGTTYLPSNTADGGRDFTITSGNYDVSVKDTDGKVDKSKGKTSKLDPCINVSPPKANSNVSLGPVGFTNEGSIMLSAKAAPNPSKNYFTLKMNSSSDKPVEIRVLDIHGRVLYTKRGSVINTYQFGERFTPGIYIIEILQNKERKTIKVVKE